MSSNNLPNPLDQLNEHEQSHRHLTGGETLFVQNTDAAGLYYLVSGIVDLRRSTHQGHDVIMHRARSGDTFAEASLFGETYHCSATARGDAYVIECRRSSVLKMLESNGEFARSMMRRFATQLQVARLRVELLSIKSADERVLMALGEGLLTEDILSFSETIGLASETVYRSLAQLCKTGQIIKTARGHYRIVT